MKQIKLPLAIKQSLDQTYAELINSSSLGKCKLFNRLFCYHRVSLHRYGVL